MTLRLCAILGIVFATAVLQAPDASAQEGPIYGAFAVTRGDGDAFGYSHGFESRRGAEREALGQCEARAGRAGCQVATWFYNSCGALALSGSGAWGADHAETEHWAAEKAMRICRAHNGGHGCHVVGTACSP